LAKKIEVLLNDEKLRETLGAKARATAVRHLDISICAQKHAEFYRQIMMSD
jgi:glycosyltransferase involved in cell wall biosynthesis